MSKAHQTSVSDQLKKGLADKGLTTRSVVAFIIFGMIVAVFVLSDLNGPQSGGGSAMGSAAEVNGELISIKDFQDEENRLSQYYSQLFGGQFDSEMQRTLLRNEVMSSLVNKSLTAQAAQKAGIYATDAEVRHMIVNELPYFKKDGVFQSDAYRSILTANRMTPSDFENKLRKDIQGQRSRQLFEASFGMTQFQKNLEKELRSSQIKLEFVALSAAEFAKAAGVSSDEVTKKLADAEFAKKVQENFAANQAQFDTQEQVKASHILVKADAQNDAAAKTKAEDLLKRAQKEDFAKLASEFSDDPGSKAKKGDLGFFSKGQMVPEFEKVAFELPVGQISGLVKSNFGYHIIKVTDKKAATKANFETLKTEIAKKLLADEKYLAFVKEIETDVAAGNADAAKAKLAQVKMAWKDTGYFNLAVEAAPVMNSAQAIKAALELTKAAPYAKKLVREGDTQYFIKLADVKVATGQLEGQEESLIEKQKANSAFTSWLNDFKKAAKIQTNTSLTSAAQ